MDDEILIRAMEEKDAKALSEAFSRQGWNKPEKQFLEYLCEQEKGLRFCIMADVGGEPAGYITVLKAAKSGPFEPMKLPEISDFNVLIRFRGRGIGSRLFKAAENVAFSLSDTSTLAVGLHAGYGTAQRMYARRGYIPDGSGVWYEDKPLSENAICRNDDDLCLYLSRQRQS